MIVPHVENMVGMDYPRDLYDVVVLADNCTDETAELAQGAGAQVWVRRDPDRRGKGYALEWALQRDLQNYDAVCVFDADNLADTSFLSVMALHLREGKQIIQAYLDTKNPWDTWITASYAIAYWYMNRFWQKARMRLGLSGALGGTGFCVATPVLQRLPWTSHSLTEDLEYTVRAVTEGLSVYWTPLTKVYDEKPVAFSSTITQRSRWLQGHWSVAFDHSPALLRKLLSESSRGSRLKILDLLVYLWQPVVILATGLDILVLELRVALGRGWYSHWLGAIMPHGIWLGLIALGFGLPLIAVNLEDVDWRAVLYLPAFYLFNLSWIPIAWIGLLKRRDRAWHHTEHHRAISVVQRPAYRRRTSV